VENKPENQRGKAWFHFIIKIQLQSLFNTNFLLKEDVRCSIIFRLKGHWYNQVDTRVAPVAYDSYLAFQISILWFYSNIRFCKILHSPTLARPVTRTKAVNVKKTPISSHLQLATWMPPLCWVCLAGKLTRWCLGSEVVEALFGLTWVTAPSTAEASSSRPRADGRNIPPTLKQVLLLLLISTLSNI